MLEIALVEYINTRPFMDGLTRYIPEDQLKLHLLPPADCARALRDQRVDLALFPVGALPNFQSVHLLPDYCIGANGKVASVFLFSELPVQCLEKVILDRHSRSSNGLSRILLKHHWQQEVEFVMPAQKHFEAIKGTTGGVVIGDQAIRLRNRFPYAYDLSENWQALTGLPFAFAVWGYNPAQIDSDLLPLLAQAMEWGITHGAESAHKWAGDYGMPEAFARKYLQEYIDYRFDAPKHRALELYLRNLIALPQLSLQVV